LIARRARARRHFKEGKSMCAVDQFWLNWWVQALVAIGTISAVVVAMFGEAFRGKFFPPVLQLDLANPEGEPTSETQSWEENGQTHKRDVPARYYHVRVSNARRWSPAQQVHVALLGMELPNANGEMVPVWSGDVPIGWRNGSIFPVSRTIGSEAFVDICSVVDGRLRLHPLLVPNNLRANWTSACTLILTILARGAEADSAPFRLKIAWDGSWHNGAQEMQRHLSITVA
jgi:hypothetical protein